MLKTLLNKSETIVDAKLAEVCQQWKARVHAKVRVADVLPIENSGVSAQHYSFALKSHFDFVIADRGHVPLFAVEFDGPVHDSVRQRQRDAIKNQLASGFNLPLLRVRSAHLQRRYDGWDLLSWMVDVWFLREEADRLYELGQLPPDFDFDPALLMLSPQHRRRFPYWLGLEAQLAIQKHHEDEGVLDMSPSMYHGIDQDEIHCMFAFLRVSRTVGVRVFVSMRSQQFPFGIHEPLRGVMYHDLLAELRSTLKDPTRAVPLSTIEAELKRFTAKHKLLSWGGYSSPWEQVT